MDSEYGLRGMVGELELALGAARVAKFLGSTGNANVEDGIGPITPRQVLELVKENISRDKFLLQIPEKDYGAGILFNASREIKKNLSLNNSQPNGFPSILLAEIPSGLFDVLLLLLSVEGSSTAFSCEDADTLKAFSLFWTLFVRNDGKASSIIYRYIRDKIKGGNHFLADSSLFKSFYDLLIREKVAYIIPDENDIQNVVAWLNDHSHDGADFCLRSWHDKFHASVNDWVLQSEKMEALRFATTHRNTMRKLLMWTQREYINYRFENYDPTSDRDEDLPIDLDHLIPQSKFGFHWSNLAAVLEYDSTDNKIVKYINEEFHYLRNEVGNSLGNFRWLESSNNRRRKDGAITQADDSGGDDTWFNFCSDGGYSCGIDAFNCIIEKPKWSSEDVKNMQKIIDLRSVYVFDLAASFIRKKLL
jgi:hypothetical protein